MAEGSGFFAELKRRHVWRVVVAYAIAGWLVIQVVTQVFPVFNLPEWTSKFVVLLIVIGFPIVVVLAWAFEITSEGIRLTAPAGSPTAREAHATRAIGRKLNALITAVLVIAVALLLANTFLWHKGMRGAAAVAQPAIAAKSIAVLPFENLSQDKDNAYFADGMQDLILTKLADIGDLKVISRTSTMKYKARPDNLKQVAAELGVATILEGSVQKSGNQVLVNVQLINAATDAHLWAQSYTRTLDNVFGVEGEVADKIATALSAKLSPAQAKQLATAPTTNPAAYDAFLRAEYQYNQGEVNYSMASWKAAIPLYRQAVTLDPKFALAWARLSMAESRLALAGGGGENVAQLNLKARADAAQALKLQPDLPAAQLALGYCDYWGQRDYAGALKAFAAVLVLRPDDADALAAQGLVQRRMGRFDDALASLTKAAALDPRNFRLTDELGSTYMLAARYPEAEQWLQRALALEPDSINAKSQYSNAILFGSGDIPRALAVVQGDDPALKSQRASLLSYQRKFPDAIALFESIPDTPDNFSPGSSKAMYLALNYWQAGDKAQARPLFAKALVDDRAALATVQGIAQATVWNGVGFDEMGSGNTTAGLEAIAKSEAILDQTSDAVVNPSYRLYDAEAYAMAGRADLAVPLLAKTLTTSGIGHSYSPLMLWLDPAWDPIRHDPRFQALLQQYAQHKPAVTYDTPPAASATATK
jgi:TolB-like protein/Tfp pilus assembly protein PilF